MTRTTALTPYRTGRAGRRIRPFSLAFMLIYCLATGVMVALLPAQLLFLLAIPLLLAVPVILWLLPDGGRVPEKLLATLLVWYLGTTVLWPSYLAIDLPGLPWINPPRIAVGLLLLIGLFSYSTSSQMRGQVAEVTRELPWIRTAFWVFWAMTVITLPLSSVPTFSLTKWANNQIYWTFMFFMGLWLARTPGFLPRLSRVMVLALIAVSLITLEEVRRQQLPWANSIPSFLKIDANYLPIILGGQARAADGLYRAHATFTTSLVLAEYGAIVFPFLIHLTLNARNGIQRGLLILAIMLSATALYFTHSRSGTIGMLTAVFVYGGFAMFRQWRRDKTSLVPLAALSMMPIVAVCVFGLAVFWPRLHNLTFGGGAAQASTIARQTQWAMGRPKIIANPIGHGPGRAAETLGFFSPGGQLTIDTYFLSLLLEYGPVGFIAFLSMFLGQLIIGLRLFLKAEGADELLVGPLTIGLLNFAIIKSVSSGEVWSPLAFILLGSLFAVAWRQRLRLPGAAATVSSQPLRSGQLAAAS